MSNKTEAFSSAFEAARRTPGMHMALVDEMRHLVATGRIGHDVHRLAHNLIDSVDALSLEQLRSTTPFYPRLVKRTQGSRGRLTRDRLSPRVE